LLDSREFCASVLADRLNTTGASRMTPPGLQASGNSRNVGLDLLRFLAVVLVIGRHMEAPPTDWDSLLLPVFDAWHYMGGLGVDLFFVLSGFLVSGLLFVEYKKLGTISLSRFYVRRAWRIYPAFYTLIVFTYFFSWLAMDWKISERRMISELFFIQNYQAGYWNHTWTLALEEHFYILLPLALLGLVRRNPGAANPFRAVPRIVAAAVVLFPVARILNYSLWSEDSPFTHVYPSHLRMDSLIFGVGISYFYHFHQEGFVRLMRPLRYPMIVLGVAMLSSTIWLGWPNSMYVYCTIGFTQYYLGAAALMAGVLMCRIPRNPIVNGMAFLGSHSYSIYLWHMALMYWAIPALRESMSWQMRTLLYFVGAFVIGVGMAKLLEAPLLRIRDRKYPSRTAPIAEPEVAETRLAA
jgi:peptidoglycan/LPS O-acetylase OafA/YrhL